MPSVSEKQKRLMAAAAHNKKFADKVGIKQTVAKEFNDKDKALDKKKKPSTEAVSSIAVGSFRDQ